MAEERTQKDKAMPHINNTAAWLSLHRKSWQQEQRLKEAQEATVKRKLQNVY